MIKLMVELLGHPDVGKSVARDHLVEDYGFTPVSASGILEEFSFIKGIELTDRASYKQVFRLMTREWDVPGIILDRSGEYTVLDGNRHPTIEDELRSRVSDFLSIALEARLRTRLARSVSRGSPKDVTTDIWEFYKGEGPEYFSPDPEDSNVIYLMETADRFVDANGTIDATNAQIDSILIPKLLVARSTEQKQ